MAGCQSKLLLPQLAMTKSTIDLLTINIKAGNSELAPVISKERIKYKGVACQTKASSWGVLTRISWIRLLRVNCVCRINIALPKLLVASN
jgi:hypothetical protein